MPRKSKTTGTGRGGPRQGTPGAAYGNRTDLNANRKPSTQPIRTPRGMPYGEAGRQAAAQKVLPIPAAPSPSAPSAASGSSGGSGSVLPPDVDPGALLASLPTLGGPTSRPTEPVTAGLPIGPGPGPESNIASGDDAVLSLLQLLHAE